MNQEIRNLNKKRTTQKNNIISNIISLVIIPSVNSLNGGLKWI